MKPVEVAVLVVLWIIAVRRAWRVSRGPRQWSLAVCEGALALAMTVGWLPAQEVIDASVHVPGAAHLAQRVFGIVAFAAMAEFLAAVSSGRRGRATMVVRSAAAAGIATLAGLFVTFPRLRVQSAGHLTDPAGTISQVAYAMVFYACLAAAAAVSGYLLIRYSRDPGVAGALRAGLLTGTVAAGAALLYAGMQAASLLGLLSGPAAQLAVAIVVAVALVLIALAAVIPSLPAGRRWLRACRALRQVYPLWRDIHVVNAYVSPVPGAGNVAGFLSAEAVTLRLYRRVIEIDDAFLLLRGYGDTRIYERALAQARAAGLDGGRARAAAQACWVIMAFRAYLAGQATRPGEAAMPVPGRGDAPADVRAEARWLAQVSRACRSSLVAGIIADPGGAALRSPAHGSAHDGVAAHERRGNLRLGGLAGAARPARPIR